MPWDSRAELIHEVSNMLKVETEINKQNNNLKQKCEFNDKILIKDIFDYS